MKSNAVIVIISIVLSKTFAQYNIINFATSRNCSEVYSIKTPKYVPYDETYRTKSWYGLPKIKIRTNYRLENHVSYQTRSVCCAGYTNFGSSLCIPICSRSCGSNGVCSAPETCKCNDGYQMDHSLNECKPVCLDECRNGDCVAPNVCDCKDGYRKLPDGFTCAPVCNSCANLEYCIEPHVCQCINGYTRPSIQRVDSAPQVVCQAVCDKECVNADCVEPNLCRCRPGYDDLDNDAFTCEPKCTRGCKNGYCTAPDTCTCLPGYRLKDNSSHICEPICSDTCVNADCIAPETCSCFDGYTPLGGEWSHVCQPYCSSNCTHGKCSDPEVCSCNAGYRSVNNKTACEPVCTETCSMGYCTAPDTCTCHDGYKLAEENIFHCEPYCSKGCTNGECTAPNECTCFEGYEKKNTTDDDSICIFICNCDNGYCNETSPECETCAEGYDLEHIDNTTVCKPHCEGGCQNGECVGPQNCECDENYIADNDTRGNQICVRACGGDCNHGTCAQENNTCSCLYGWAGKFCDEPTLCALVLLDEQSAYLQVNESLNYEEAESIVEEQWTGPNCSNRCLQEVIDNKTKCVGPIDNRVMNITCFLNIDLPCNAFVVALPDEYRVKSNFSTSILYITVALIMIITTVGAVFIIRKRRRQKSIELLKSIQQIRKQEGNNLLENDGISL